MNDARDNDKQLWQITARDGTVLESLDIRYPSELHAPSDDNEVILIDGERWILHGHVSGHSLYPSLLADKQRFLEGEKCNSSTSRQPTQKVDSEKKETKRDKRIDNIGYDDIVCVAATKMPPPPESMRVSLLNDTQPRNHNCNFNIRQNESSINWYNQSEVSSMREVSDDDENNCTVERITMEIMPGVNVIVRGNLETRNAICHGTIRQTFCLDCCSSLGVIQDAEYVLCPMCRSLTPMAVSLTPEELEGAYGVGLGFVHDRYNHSPEDSTH